MENENKNEQEFDEEEKYKQTEKGKRTYRLNDLDDIIKKEEFDKITYDDKKNDIIDFVLTSITKSEE